MTRRRGQDGAIAVELALVLPLLMFIVAGVVDFGLALMVKAQVEEGAEEAAIHAARYPKADQVPIAKQRAADAVSFVTLTPAEITISCTGAGTGVGRRITVAVHHEYDMIFGFIVDDIDVSVTIKSEVLSDEACP